MPKRGRYGGNETIKPPSQKLLSREAKKLRNGDPAAGRILAEAAVAARERVGRYRKKP